MFKYLLLSALIFNFITADPDFYWRAFMGEIPPDAVVAANTTQKVYIGRGPYRENGEVVGQILANVPSLTITVPGLLGSSIHTITEHIEILCSGHPNKFVWVPANYQTLNYISGKVEGGFETTDNGVLYIGKAVYNTLERIGKVAAYDFVNPRNQILYIADTIDGEVKAELYQVLTYDDSPDETTTVAATTAGDGL